MVRRELTRLKAGRLDFVEATSVFSTPTTSTSNSSDEPGRTWSMSEAVVALGLASFLFSDEPLML